MRLVVVVVVVGFTASLSEQVEKGAVVLLSWTRGKKDRLCHGEAKKRGDFWSRARTALFHTFSMIARVEERGDGGGARLKIWKSGLGLSLCNPRWVLVLPFSNLATSLFAPLARRAGLA